MEMENFVRAGYPAIILTTAEEERALFECSNLAKKLNKSFEYWTLTGGVQKQVKDYSKMTNRDVENEITNKQQVVTDPVKALEAGLKDMGINGKIFLMLDFHSFVKTSNVWRRAKDVFKIAKAIGVTYVFADRKSVV